jgi:hypothetical protein
MNNNFFEKYFGVSMNGLTEGERIKNINNIIINVAKKQQSIKTNLEEICIL